MSWSIPAWEPLRCGADVPSDLHPQVPYSLFHSTFIVYTPCFPCHYSGLPCTLIQSGLILGAVFDVKVVPAPKNLV